MGTAILIVDDDEVLGRILVRVLKGYGYAAVHATAADQALQLAREYHPRLALVDLCMPGTGGVEMAHLLRAELADLALILITAYPMRLREHAELAGTFARVLVKPLDLAALREAVREALARSGNGVGMMKLS
jgi:CheY-like chemotaxis protein